MKDKSTIEQEEKPRGELFIDLIEKLLDTNYLMLELLDQRLTTLEDQIDFECSKKEGK